MDIKLTYIKLERAYLMTVRETIKSQIIGALKNSLGAGSKSSDLQAKQRKMRVER